MPYCLAIRSSSLKAHSFAVILETFPNFFTNPATQSPSLFWITSPPPAFFGSPNTEPSVFSFTYPDWGLLHFTWTWILLGLLGMFGTVTKNSTLFLIQRALNPLSTFFSWNMALFLWSQILQRVWGDRIFQGMRGLGKNSDEPQYFSNQSVKERCCKFAYS